MMLEMDTQKVTRKWCAVGLIYRWIWETSVGLGAYHASRVLEWACNKYVLNYFPNPIDVMDVHWVECFGILWWSLVPPFVYIDTNC